MVASWHTTLMPLFRPEQTVRASDALRMGALRRKKKPTLPDPCKLVRRTRNRRHQVRLFRLALCSAVPRDCMLGDGSRANVSLENSDRS